MEQDRIDDIETYCKDKYGIDIDEYYRDKHGIESPRTEQNHVAKNKTFFNDDISEIAKALCEVQKTELFAITDSTNPFLHNSKYADLSSVWAAIRKPLTDNGLSIIQTTEPYEGGVTVVTTMLHISGESVASRLSVKVPPLKPDKAGQEQSNIQKLGSAITYLRRYALAAMVGVCPTDDDAEAVVDRTKQGESKKTKDTPQKSAKPEAKTKSSPDAAKEATPEPNSPVIHEMPKGKTLLPVTFTDDLTEYPIGDAFAINVIRFADTHYDVNGSGVWTDGNGNFYSNAKGFTAPPKCVHIAVVDAIQRFGADAVQKAYKKVRVAK